MSVKVTRADSMPKAPRDIYPRLVRHEPTGAVLLQIQSGNKGVLLIHPSGDFVGSLWTINNPANYVPYNGKLTLENE